MRDRFKVRREMRVTARLAARLKDKFSDCHAGRRTFDTVGLPSLVDTRTHTAYIPGIATQPESANAFADAPGRKK